MSRELYDLCRRYKHYWKKVEDVKHLNDKYHDLDLACAISHSYGQLMETEDDMLKELFRDYNVMCSNIEVECQNDFPLTRIVSSNATLTIHESRRFIKCLSDYMCDRRIGR